MVENDPDEQPWMDVYKAREDFFAAHFGTISGDVQKLMNLVGVWPGGCLVQIEAPSLGLCITSSFGLTNKDMPATTRTEDYEIESKDGRPVQFRSRIVAREPRAVPLSAAGYGFELLVFTQDKAFWPLMFLNWAVPGEILHDFDILGRIHEYGMLTIEDVSLGSDLKSDFIIAPIQALAPARATLPNGTMELLVATAITRAEMNFALRTRRPALLLEHLMATQFGQTSILERSSAVE